MRLTLFLPLALLACSEHGMISSDGGFASDFDVGAGDDCAPVREQDVVSFDLTVREHVLGFDNPCGEGDLRATLDDPAGAFEASDVDYRTGIRVEVRVGLIAAEPGIYEAQLIVGRPDGGQTAVELFAQIDQEEE